MCEPMKLIRPCHFIRGQLLILNPNLSIQVIFLYGVDNVFQMTFNSFLFVISMILMIFNNFKNREIFSTLTYFFLRNDIPV